ncbi:MAG TPA: hypothetical protein ACFYD6_02635 [Candidatus Brocadiia bacterium]|nr:hypothetical protein [Candidatus Brocadiales bacterium]
MTTAKKMLFILDEEVRKELETLIPPGKRSRVVNDALQKELLLLKRKKLTSELLDISSRTHPVSTKEIVEELKKDRRRR